MKKILPTLLILGAFAIISCGKKDNKLKKSSGLEGVETGKYIGVYSLTINDYTEDGKNSTYGGDDESVELENISGNIYIMKPEDENLPSIKMDFNKIEEGYGFFVIEGQKCKYGDLIAVPMTNFGMAYNGIYNPPTHSLDCGYIPDSPMDGNSLMILKMGGVVIKQGDDIIGYMQISITKR